MASKVDVTREDTRRRRHRHHAMTGRITTYNATTGDTRVGLRKYILDGCSCIYVIIIFSIYERVYGCCQRS